MVNFVIQFLFLLLFILLFNFFLILITFLFPLLLISLLSVLYFPIVKGACATVSPPSPPHTILHYKRAQPHQSNQPDEVPPGRNVAEFHDTFL